MDTEYNSLSYNEKEFVDRMILDIRFGLRRTDKGQRRLRDCYDISIYDMPRIMKAFSEQASKLTDADLFPADQMMNAIYGDEVMKRDYDSMDDESAMIAMINDSITSGLLSEKELDELNRNRKTGDFICKVVIIAVLTLIFVACFVFGVR